MRGVRFETRQSTFNSIDYRFELDAYVTQNRIVLDPVSVSIPGRDPVYFRPQQGERDLQLSFSYVGENFLNDLDKFVSKLYNSRMPLRIILARESDRYYVGQIIALPTEDRYRLFGKAEVTAQLLRNYALRRWKDDEITPDNPDINFSMPIVPIKAEHDLTGSSIVIPYYNEGIDLPLVLELSGVDKPTIIAGDTVAHYSRKIDGKLILDFEYMKARENGTDRSGYLSGDPVEIPHGDQQIRLHYQIPRKIAVQATDERYEDFIQGTPVTNTQVVELADEYGAVTTSAIGAGEYISREIPISTSRRPQRAVLSFIQNQGGSIEFDVRLFLNGQWTDWLPVAYDGTIQGIDHNIDLTGAKIQYRARFDNYYEPGVVTILEDFEDTSYQFNFYEPSGSEVPWGRYNDNGNYRFKAGTMTSTPQTHKYSRVEFPVEVPYGATDAVLSLLYRVSSEPNYDHFRIYVDNFAIRKEGPTGSNDTDAVLERSGEVGWTQWSYPLSPGVHIVRLEYHKDGATDGGQDTAFVDDIKLEYRFSEETPPQTLYKVSISIEVEQIGKLTIKNRKRLI